MSLDWILNGNCQGVDPNLFFPDRGESLTEAKQVCQSCQVQTACLDYALSGPEKFGVWGGTSERERRRLRRQKTVAA